ncbi:MAG: hypothetical protein RLZZ77_2137 [Bacteroidota bacterium]
MFDSHQMKWLIGFALTALTTVLVAINFGDLFFHPNQYLVNGSGDAIKNYFTFAWHIQHDENWLAFEGSNYPYGEHVGYTDGHPLFSLLFSKFDFIKNNPIGFLNYWIILSPILSVLVLFALFIRLKINSLTAALGALSITWLNPQVYRMVGHFSLSYSWMIPLYLLLFFRAKEKNKWYGLTLYNLAIFFIHPYMGMGMTLFTVLFIIIDSYTLKFKKQWNTRVNGLAWILAFVPPLFFVFFSKWTDTHTNRPANAKGFLAYTSSPESIVLPNSGPIREVLPDYLTQTTTQWEGWSYIGFATIVVWLIWVGLRFKNKEAFQLPQWLGRSLIISTLILFFAFGWPFSWKLEVLLEKIPFIQQFRSPGRFAWFFYFIITIGAVWVINQMLNWKKSWGYITLVFFTVMMVWEGQAAFLSIRPQIGQEPNYFNAAFLPEQWRKDIAEIKTQQAVEAIVPLPFFHYGSDYFAYLTNESTKQKAYIIAYHTAKPLVASSNPRVSLTESREQLALFALNNYWPNNRIEEKWFLVRDDRSKDQLTILENVLWQNGQSSASEEVKTISAEKWHGVTDRVALVHKTYNDSLIAESPTNWKYNSTLAKGNFDIVSTLDNRVLKENATYYVEYEIECHQEEGIPHLLLILQQKSTDGAGSWPSVVTMNSVSGLPDDHYHGIFEVNGLMPGHSLELVTHHNEPSPISYVFHSWKLFVKK